MDEPDTIILSPEDLKKLKAELLRDIETAKYDDYRDDPDLWPDGVRPTFSK
jgi:hypothetical protein